MPRPSKTTETVRLTIEMAVGVRKQLEHLRDRINADSLTEVIRRSLAAYDLLTSATACGGRIVIQTADGEKELILA